jgi:hypothetical protein
VAVTTTTAPSTLAPAPPAPAAADDCAPGAWPAVVSGRPAAYLAGQDGAYLWLDPDGGWALRVTHARPKERLIFSGSLTTSGRFSYLGQPAGEGGNDILELGAARHTIFFRFVDFGSVDGLDFATSCSRSITLKLVVDGQPASPAMVHLGPGETSPSNNPVKIQRVREATDQDITSSPTSTTVP